MALKKQYVLKLVNPVIGILFIVQGGSGIFHESIPYEIFEVVHGIGGYLLVAGIISHVLLNWSWFKTAYSKRK